VPIRGAYALEEIITLDHLDRLAKLLLTCGLLVTYCYIAELGAALYSDNPRERATYFVHWPFGPFGWLYWTMLVLNVVVPQLFWFSRFRRSLRILFAVSIAVLVGMWIERFVIIVPSLTRGPLPSSWYEFAPTWVDWGLLVGSISVFGVCYLLFLRFVPAAAIGELRRHHFEEAIERRR